MSGRVVPFCERPLAGPGFISYRLFGPYGWIMIAAKDDEDAMREARRSTEYPDRRKLQKWDGSRYGPA